MVEKKQSKIGNKRTLPRESQADMDKVQSKEASRSFQIVAIGASAGGIGAFQKFLGSLPPDSGMAFVFILHLSPDQKSMLSDIMGQYTQMKVSQIEHGMKVEPNRVYVIPPNTDLKISEGRLILSKLLTTKGIRQPIDHFFRSLAESCEENAIGIILSGTGSDGALGIKAIKAYGGLVVAQEPESAQYSGMPRSAIETGMVDLILPLEKIPERLIEFSRRSRVMHKRERPQEVLQAISEVLPKILQAIQKQTGHDFSSYKTSTVIRRITRRMVVNGFDDPLDYLKFLKETHEEGQFLFQDLLISVTQFFRDAETFDILKEKVIGPIVQGHEGEDPIKVWIPGCATGEEAYTIAILFREKMNELNRQALKIQIFATDLDELAINNARLGRFPDNITADMTAERLEKFFRKVDDVYQVANSVREMIIFSLHNLTNNPPFSKLNLVCCRNLLIYLNADMQRKILPLFHYALKPQGYLLLGTSETLGSFDELFDVIDKRWKIFQRKESSKPLAIDFPLKAIEPLRQGEKLVSSAMTRSQAGNMAEKALLQRYSPPSVVVNEKFEIIHFSTRISRYLEQPVGEPTMNILKMAREELRPKLRVGLRKAISNQETNYYNGLKLHINGSTEVLNLIVEALREPASKQKMALVVFEPVTSMADKSSAKDSPVSTNNRETSEIEVKQLEEDLRVTSEQLQSTIEELETSNEELKSSNEELMSMNEELQSTNEEVESSKEELQALNEELTTVNSELERKVDELADANSFMQNLLNSSQVATVFLDRKLRLKRFTPDATEIFNLLESDINRPFHHITGNLDYPTINKDAEQVLKTLKSIETEVLSSEGRYYLLRILPYRTIKDVIDGVVITLIDITDRKQSEQVIKEGAEKLRKLADSMPQLVWSADVDGRIVYINEHYNEFKGIMQRQDGSWEWEPVLHSDDRERTVAAWQAAIQDENDYQIEHRIKCADDSYRWFLSRAKLVKDNKEQSIMWFGTATDIDDLKKTEQALAEARKNAEAAAQAKSDFLANMSHEIRTPMTIFLGALEHLQAIDNIPEHRKLLDMAEKSSKHLRELIDDILDFSQIEAGRVEFFETSFNIRSWLEEIISMFNLTAEEKGLELKGTLSKNVPEIIVGDSSRLQQVLINLIGNAIKFTAEGEVSVTVKVRDKQLVFAVADTGIGIAEDKQHLLFQNFSQVDASFHRQHTGTGLGLAISKKLVELMGGKIIMQKRPGQGSIFTVTLPLKMTSMTEIKKRPETDVCEVGLSNVCILLADDDPMICELVTMELSSRGWQTDVAKNGEEAITKWQQGDYDAILMDLQMPGMDGLEATRMIRRKEEGQDKHICVIGFTAHARQKTLKDCLEAGMDGVLTKPIRTEDLYAIINKSLT